MRERQLGTRNLPEKKFLILVNDIRDDRSKIAKKERAEKGREVGGKATVGQIEQRKDRLSVVVSDKRSEKKDQRKSIAKEFKVRERALRTVQEINSSSSFEALPFVF